MKKLIIGLALACATSTTYATEPDKLTLRFMNCTGKAITAEWSGYKTNVDKNPGTGVQSGTFTLPAGKLIINKTLRIYRTALNAQDEHSFNLVFTQGLNATTNLTFTQYKHYYDNYYGNKISLSSSDSIYLPNTTINVDGISPAPVADIQLGCVD